jgi:hypothetical protein
MMSSGIRLMLGLETAIFLVASLIHFEVLFDGYPDREAGIAEMVIGVVLLAGFIYTFLAPQRERITALVVQGFALAGTLVGLILLIALGPATALDVFIHLVMITVLVIGLVTAWRARPSFHAPRDRVIDHSTRR